MRGTAKGRVLAVLIVASRKGTLVGLGIGWSRVRRRLGGDIYVTVVGDGVNGRGQVVSSGIYRRRCTADCRHCRRQDRGRHTLVIDDDPRRVPEVIVVVAITRREAILGRDGQDGAAEGKGCAQDRPCVHGDSETLLDRLASLRLSIFRLIGRLERVCELAQFDDQACGD